MATIDEILKKYQKALTKKQIEDLIQKSEQYKLLNAGNRANAQTQLAKQYRQTLRGLQNMGLAGREGKLLSGREIGVKDAYRNAYGTYNQQLQQSESAMLEKDAARKAAATIRARQRQVELQQKGIDYEKERFNQEQITDPRLSMEKPTLNQTKKTVVNTDNVDPRFASQIEAPVKSQVADYRHFVNQVEDLEKAREQYRQAKEYVDNYTPKSQRDYIGRRKYAEAKNLVNQYDAYVNGDKRARFAVEYNVDLDRVSVDDPETARKLGSNVEYWYNLIDQNSQQWDYAIKNHTHDEASALERKANAYGNLSRIAAAAKAPAEQRKYYLMSDEEFDTAYDAAERAYKRAEQEYQIAKKDNSGNMDDLISEPKAALEKAMRMKTLMDQIKASRVSNSQISMLASEMQIPESAKTKDKEYASTKEYVDENQAAGKITLKTKDWTLNINPWTNSPSQNWASVRDIGWSADDYAKAHDIKGSKYAALINEWSLINGRTAALFGPGQLDNLDPDAVGGTLDFIQALFGANRADTDVNYKWFRDECLMTLRGNYDDTGSDAQKEQMDAMLTLANLMTDEERARFNALLDTMGAKAADDYFDLLYKNVLPGRFAAYVSDYNADYMDELPWAVKAAFSVESVLPSLTQGIPGIAHAYSTNQQDPVAARVSATGYNQAQNIRNARMHNFGKVGQFAYGTAMSMWDSYFAAAVSQGVGKAFAAAGVPTAVEIGGKTVNLAEKAGSVIGGSLLGASAYNATYQEGLERGLTPEKARMTALGSGINEMLFESLSLDMLVGHFQKGGILKVSKKALVNWIVNTLVQGGVEGSEEVFTDIGNNIWDKMVNGIYSEELTKIREYVSQGMTFEQAKRKVDKEFAEQLGMSFLGGAVSGGVMGGGSTFLGMVQNIDVAKIGSNLDENAKAEIREYDFQNEEAKEILTGKLTDEDYGRLAMTRLEEMAQTDPIAAEKAAQSLIDATARTDVKVDKRTQTLKTGTENSVSFDYDGVTDVKKMSGVQVEALRFAQTLVKSKVGGVNINVANQLYDKNGNEQNGWYDAKTNTVHVSLNGSQSVVYTISHELTHRLKSGNEEAYASMRDAMKSELESLDLTGSDLPGEYENILGDYLVKDGEQRTAWEALIEYEMDRYKKHNIDLDRESAEEEVVCRACETMLERSRLISSMISKNVRGAKTIAKFLASIYDDIASLKEEAESRGYEDGSPEKLFIDQYTDVEKIANAWANAMKTVSQEETKKIVKEEGRGGTAFSLKQELRDDGQSLADKSMKYRKVHKAESQHISDATLDAANKARQMKQHGQKFSIKESDAQYMDLARRYESGDKSVEAELRKAVDAAAERWGARTNDVDSNPETGEPEKSLYFYHGSKSDHTVFKGKMAGKNGSAQGQGFYFSTDEIHAKRYAFRDDGYGKLYKAFLKANNPLRSGEHRISQEERRQILLDMDRKGMDGHGYTYSVLEEIYPITIDSEETYNHFVDEYIDFAKDWDDAQFYARLSTRMGFYAATTTMLEHGYDASIMEKHDKSQAIVVVFTPQQIKSADLITKDDSGNIIPLSERFKTDRTGEDAWKNEDIRYSLKEGEERAIKIADGKTKDGETVSFIDRILDGEKTGETRTTRASIKPNAWVGIYKDGKVYGRVKFGDPMWITKQSKEYKTSYIKDTNYDIDDSVGGKWYYPVLEVQDFRDNPIPTNRAGQWGAAYNLPMNEGIRYSVNDKMPRSAQEQRDQGYKLSKAKFDSLYSAHKIDIGKRWGSVDAQIQDIRENGFKGGSGAINVLPVTTYDIKRWRGVQNYNEYHRMEKEGTLPKGTAERYRTELGDEYGKPMFNNVVQEEFALKKGETVLLVPKSDVQRDMVKQGFKPLPYEVVTAERDYQPLYELYEKSYDEYVSSTNEENEDIRYSLKDTVEGESLGKDYLKYLQLGAKVVNQTATEEEIKEFKQRMNELSEDNRAAFLDKLREKLIRADEAAKVREVRDRQIARLKEEFKESKEKARERRIRSDLTATLKKGNDRIVQLLSKPTENAHVPVQLAQAVAEYAQRLNQLLTTSEPKTGEFAGMEKQTQKGALNAQKILDALKRSYADAETIEMLKAEDPKFDPRGLIPVQFDENGKMIKDDSLAEMVNGMDEIIQGKHLNELTTDELRYVMNTMRGVIYAVTEANKVTVDGESRNVYRTSRKMANEVKSASKVFGDKSNAITKFLNRYVIESLGLRRIAKLYSGSNENATFVKLVDDLNEGAIEQERIKQTLRNMFNDVTQKYEKDMNTWYGKNAEWIDTGFGFRITKGMRVSLAMHILNEQNLRNVEKAGLRIPEQSAYRKGNYKEAYKNGKVYRLTKAQAEQIVANMTEAEKAYFEVAKEFFHKQSGKYINRTSLKLLGFSKAIVDNYFPIQTDDAYRAVKYDDVRQNGSVEHPGFLEARNGTANVMYLNDITAVVNRQIDGVAKYAGLAIPMRNWNNVMNAWLFEENENGEWVRSDEGRPHDVLERRMGYTNGKGKAVIEYVDQFITDLTSPGKRDANENVQAAEFAAKLTSNYVKAVLTLNARVALSQLASVPTAASEIPWKYIVQSFGGHVEGNLNRNASNELIDMYTPIFAMRRAGTQTEVSEVMKRKGFADKAEQKLPGLLGWITAMDTAATRRLWYACERWVKGETNIPVGSDAFYQEVAKRYERVIQNTQPNFTVLQRSPALRSKNAAARIITMFGTQRMQNGGILIESAAEVVQAKDAATRKAALKKFGRALSGQITAAIVLGISRAIVAALRGRMKPLQDEDKEITFKSVDKYIRGEVATSLAGSFMYVGEIYDFVHGFVSGITEGDSGYDQSFALPAAEALSTLIGFFRDKDWQYFAYMNAKDENGNPKHTDHEKWLKTKSFINELMTVASYATGLPLANLSKTILNGLHPFGHDIADAIKTGEFLPWLRQSGRLDKKKTNANYNEWTNLGFKGSEYLYWEKKLSEYGKRDERIPILLDSDLTDEQKALMLRMMDNAEATSEGTKVYKKNGDLLIDFANPTEKQQALPMPEPKPSIELTAEPTTEPTAEPTATQNPLSEAKQEGVKQAVAQGVPEQTANDAFLTYQNIGAKEGRDDEFREWLFKNVSDPHQRAVLDYQVIGRAAKVEGAVTYKDNGTVYRDYTNANWYKLSNRKASSDGTNKRYDAAKKLEQTGLTVDKTVAIYDELDKLSKKAEWKEYMKEQGLTDEQIYLFLWSRGWAKLK